MKKAIILIIIPLVLLSCRAPKGLETTRAERLHTVETVRDTVISLAPDTALLQALLECDSLGQVHIKEIERYQAGERVKPPVINLDNNVLTLLSEQDSLNIYLKIRDRYTEKVTADKETETVYINELKTWQKILMYLGAAFIALLLISIYKLFTNNLKIK